MPQCTEAERAFLDTGSFDDFERVSYQLALKKAGPEFFESLVRAFVELARLSEAYEARDVLMSRASQLGFTSGKTGGISMLWDAAENEAKKRTEKGT